ncbi:MAG: hypothetical protein EP346_05080 [Bacteroidetes bacterium]|nr:MAG: hypothetical protein EP346_05080 [Bacteroidota bacterium]
MMAIIGYSTASYSQLSLQAFTGYQFFGSAYTYQGQLRIQPSNVLGAAVTFKVRRDVGFNIMYSYQNTDVNLERSANFYEERLFEMDVHYVMLGSSYFHKSESKLTPYGGVLFGLSIMDPLERSRNSEVFFAIGAQGGVQVKLTPVLGLNFRGQILAPLTNVGAALWCGTGGCDVGLSAGSTLIQMNVSAGLDITLD